jgi:hypothetical protein
MRQVLTTQSTVRCGHIPPTPGTVTTTSVAKLKVNGSPVLLESSVVGQGVVLCGTPQVQGNKICTKVMSVANIPPPKLAVAGAPVLVDSIKGTTDGQVGGTPQATLAATANQSKLGTT